MACLSVLDVLLALARYSRCGEGMMCRPQLMLPNDDTTVSISATTVSIDNITVNTGAISNEFRPTLCCYVTGFWRSVFILQSMCFEVMVYATWPFVFTCLCSV